MKITLVILLSLLPCLSHAETISGKVRLRILSDKEMYTQNMLKKEFSVSKDVHVRTGLLAITFFKDLVVADHALITNKSSSKKRITYSIALFDIKGALIGSASTSPEILPNRSTALGSCMVRLTSDQISRIRKYQISAIEIPIVAEP